MKAPDLTGRRFGKLIVIEKVEYNRKIRSTIWRCRCDCGNEKNVAHTSLTRGICRSCGCLYRESAQKNGKYHGDSQSRIYRIWYQMIKRCHDPKTVQYERYGGRGIAVCDKWRTSYFSFRDWAVGNGYAENLTIDRIDNNGNYCPENCRWISMDEQANNKRNTIYFEFLGYRKSLKQWTDFMGWSCKKYYARHERGKQIFEDSEIEQIKLKLRSDLYGL